VFSRKKPVLFLGPDAFFLGGSRAGWNIQIAPPFLFINGSGNNFRILYFYTAIRNQAKRKRTRKRPERVLG